MLIKKLTVKRRKKITTILNNLCIFCNDLKYDVLKHKALTRNRLYCKECSTPKTVILEKSYMNYKVFLCPYCGNRMGRLDKDNIRDFTQPPMFTSICIECFSYHLGDFYLHYNEHYKNYITKRNNYVLHFLFEYNKYKNSTTNQITKHSENKISNKNRLNYEYDSKDFNVFGVTQLDYSFKPYDVFLLDEEHQFIDRDKRDELIFYRKSNIEDYHDKCIFNDSSL